MLHLSAFCRPSHECSPSRRALPERDTHPGQDSVERVHRSDRKEWPHLEDKPELEAFHDSATALFSSSFWLAVDNCIRRSRLTKWPALPGRFDDSMLHDGLPATPRARRLGLATIRTHSITITLFLFERSTECLTSLAWRKARLRLSTSLIDFTSYNT